MGRRRCSSSATPASAEAFHLGIRLLKILVEPSIRAGFPSARLNRLTREDANGIEWPLDHDPFSRRSRLVRNLLVAQFVVRRAQPIGFLPSYSFASVVSFRSGDAALLDVRASRQAQDRPPSADRRVEAIVTTSESSAGGRMRHVLDNPVCNALIGPHADVALSHRGGRHRLLDAPAPPVLSREPTVVPG